MYAQYSKIVNFSDLPDPGDTWELAERIGEGTYGEVYAAKHKETGQTVAVKIMESIHEVVEEIEEEYLILKELGDHPNMPHFHGLYLKQDPQGTDQLWIAMELCSGGSVTDLVKAQLAQEDKMAEHLIAHILKETMSALQHLHSNRVIHRDVKGHNILLTTDAQVKLVDFGVSGHLKATRDRRNTSVGTPFWMAPEVIACEQQLEYDYDNRCDVWSLGVTAVELADGEPPLADLNPMRALFKIPRSPPPAVRDSSQWSPDFMDFISKCVIKDFEKRPYIEELLKHPFISNVPEDTAKLQEELRSLIKLHVTDSVLHEPYVTTKHGQLRSKRNAKKQPISAVDDLATLETLEEEVIVEQLYQRYSRNLVYTYIGDILLAVNPFTPLNIYNEEHSKLYRNVSKVDNPPHIYAIADQSYQMMMHDKHDQCIVISGESGAGKTESANFLVQQLTQLGRAPNRTLEDKILQVNPLVEAFGNAKTVINDNSSRFGKYLEMNFTTNGKVTGARLSEYLLEKSRVIHQSQGESNFHVFYYIHDGLAHDDKLGKYHLKNPQKRYRYLNGSSQDDATHVAANRTKFKTIQKCFEIIGFKGQEVSAIYSILAAILHLGNIEFVEKEHKHQTFSTIDNLDLIDIVSDLLGIDGKELQEALITSGMVARGETIIKRNSVAEAGTMRDALAKAMYGRLFSWIVNKVNQLLKPAKVSKTTEVENFTIGILDIFGFENFAENNSFEQLCINIANEQIQYYFNQHIFAWEQQEYENEGVSADKINFVDNRPVLDMCLGKPMGILALLDEESNFPKATDFTLVEKFQQNIKTAHFIKAKSQGLSFTVEHYAGKVEYDAADFLEKNRDRLALEIVNFLRLSQIALVRTLFSSPIAKTGNLAYNSLSSSMSSLVSSPSGSVGSAVSIRSASNSSSTQSRVQQTVATYFRYSLMDLLSKMVAGTPHFVRCIRPNVENSPGLYDRDKVMVQLRYTGVLETTRIRRQGFSHRIPFSEFLKRYYILGFNFNEKVRVNHESCELLLSRIGLHNWAMGKSKVFLKYYHIEQLSRKFEEQQRRIVMAQAVMRMWLQRRRFRKDRDSAIRCAVNVQRLVRGWLIRRKYRLKDRTKAALLLQKGVRGFLVRRKVKPLLERRHSAILKIQATTRGFLQKKKFSEFRSQAASSAVKIQAVFRGHRSRLFVERLKMSQNDACLSAAVVLQKNFRMWKAQSQLVQMQLHQDPGDAAGGIPISNKTDLEHHSGMSERVPSGGSGHPELSEERKEQLRRAHETKSPWTDKDSGYYDSMMEENKGSPSQVLSRRRDKMKRLASVEGRQYYDDMVAEMNRSSGSELIKHDSGVYESAPGGRQLQHSLPSNREEQLQRELAEVDEMFRGVLAASVASSFLANKPPEEMQPPPPAAAAAAAPSSASPRLPHPFKKTESQYSLAWDTALEQARQIALAPDDVQLHNECLGADIASDVGTGTPSTLGSEEEVEDMVDQEENTKEIQILNDIEADGFVYREELIEEQEELRAELMRSLEMQHKNSLSERFLRRQRTSQDQEETQQRWQQIQEDTMMGGDGDGSSSGVYQKILSRQTSRDSIGSGPVAKKHANVTLNKTSVEPLTGTTEAGEQGAYNFRSLLRKTNFDPEKEKTVSPPEEDSSKTPVDYRSVLKRRSADESQLRRHVFAS